jgi:hypothetical protein
MENLMSDENNKEATTEQNVQQAEEVRNVENSEAAPNAEMSGSQLDAVVGGTNTPPPAPKVHDFTITKRTDASSPLLML